MRIVQNQVAKQLGDERGTGVVQRPMWAAKRGRSSQVVDKQQVELHRTNTKDLSMSI